jgi:hypothetical protein
VGLAIYSCAACHNSQFFLLKFDENLSYVMKVGQYPAWSVSVDKNLSRVLHEHEDNYQKGLISESQGYGIGAYAYYRRIVEDIIDKLLGSIRDMLPEGDKEAYEKALEETRKSVIAKDKIALVKDLLPVSLRPDNMNPLSILHDNLSAGIHAKTDEECLELAGNIREILVYLVEKINEATRSKETSKQFTDSMRKLLDKKRSGNI